MAAKDVSEPATSTLVNGEGEQTQLITARKSALIMSPDKTHDEQDCSMYKETISEEAAPTPVQPIEANTNLTTVCASMSKSQREDKLDERISRDKHINPSGSFEVSVLRHGQATAPAN